MAKRKATKVYIFSDGSRIYDDANGQMADKHMLYNPNIRCVAVEDYPKKG